ncbi:MAG TPA: nuclear transport factor 2 family protein [Pyrinomonadaceae bacterium]|nr:nuclear transport factor 2 family protein [Pyrinomonadaceae bacterium]
MKNFVACLFVSVSTLLLRFGFYSFSPDGIAKSKVLVLMKELHEAEKNRDEEKLKQILANEISWSRNREQKLFTKKQFIEKFKNIEFEIKSTDAILFSTEIQGNKVRVYFTMKQTFVGENIKTLTHVGDYIYTFEKQQDKWKLTSIHLEN